MKNILAISLFLFSLSSFAQWFPVQARVQATQIQISAYVDNHFVAPIVCRGNAAGITYRGLWAYAYFNDIVIYPGSFAVANAYTNVYDPFVRFQSQIFCRWY